MYIKGEKGVQRVLGALRMCGRDNELMATMRVVMVTAGVNRRHHRDRCHTHTHTHTRRHWHHQAAPHRRHRGQDQT
jgi:hypothetical protein